MDPVPTNEMNDPKITAIDQPQAEHRTLSTLAAQANLARRFEQLKSTVKPKTLKPLRLTRSNAIPG
jgi:hypothetical protein